MKIDILSDLHIDFYLKYSVMTEKNIVSFFKPILGDGGDVLIIAGDIGHDNGQNLALARTLHQNFYKYIICVLGNHDYYIANQYEFKDSFERASQMRALLNSEDGIFCLDSSVAEIEGVRFGGADSWYDRSYIKKYFPLCTVSDADALWGEFMNDSNYIYGIKKFDDIAKIEQEKLERVYQKCDVMITHVNPSFDEKHIDKEYKNSAANTFFTFDGSKFYQNGIMKYWIFGHTHKPIEYEINGIKFLCNPLGYPNESDFGEKVKIKSFVLP